MSAPDPRLRISDSDRERAMADLARHYADGRLDHEEYDERLDAIWTARTRADLAVLFSDLPRPQVSYPPAKPAAQAGRSAGLAAAVPPGARAAHRAQHPHRCTRVAADLPADVPRAGSPRGLRAGLRPPRRLPPAQGPPRLVAPGR